MNWKTTSLLVVVAALLFGFIYFFERHLGLTGAQADIHLVAAQPLEVTNIVLRRTNQLILRADRAEKRWNLSFPRAYPAQSVAIDRLLKEVHDLTSVAWISPREMNTNQRTIAEFGLDAPPATLVLQHGGRRTELLFGARTAAGDQVYLQLFNAPGIYIVNAKVLDELPRTANDWRDTALVGFAGLNFTRLEVRGAPARGFVVEFYDASTRAELKKPINARASFDKLTELLQKISYAQVTQFVADESPADLEPYGLQPPAAELAFGEGTNDLVVVQFGKSPPQAPNLVYARRLSQSNIVLVAKTVLEALLTSYTELRDRHLLDFPPAAIPTVDTLEVGGAIDPFVVRRQTNGLWLVNEPQPVLADSGLIADWLQRLSLLQGNVEKDVVTDLAPYGLATPALRYLLKTTRTNAAGATNIPLAQLELGLPGEGKIYARGIDQAVYSVNPVEFQRLPIAAWQLRDRRVWTFATNQVTSLSVRYEGQGRQLLRSPAGEWSFAPGSQGVVNPAAIEKLLDQLGQLRALTWVARGAEQRGPYGFTPTGQKLTIEAKVGETARQFTLEFSERTSTQVPFALALVEGQTWILEVPAPLFFECARFTSSLFLPRR
jgi:hypothetical protein